MRRLLDVLFLGALAIALGLTSVPARAQGSHPGIAVRINGVEISYQRFNAFYEEMQRAQGINVAARGDFLHRLTELRRDAMDLLIEQELVRQAAEAAKIEVGAEEIDQELARIKEPFKETDSFKFRLEEEGFTEEDYRTHLGRMIAATEYLGRIRAAASDVSDTDLEAYYQANTARLTLPEQVRVRHILLVFKPMGTTDDRAAIRAQLTTILERARAGEDFAELARTLSGDSETAVNGGDTGLFQRGQMVPAFEEVAFATLVGEVSDIVETPFGLHIIKVEEHQEARLLPLDEVREPLREHVRDERAEEAVKREIARLREAAKIEILIPL